MQRLRRITIRRFLQEPRVVIRSPRITFLEWPCPKTSTNAAVSIPAAAPGLNEEEARDLGDYDEIAPIPTIPVRYVILQDLNDDFYRSPPKIRIRT